MIYHVLPELEPFSAFRGGALAHTVANYMRLDASIAVVCRCADESWNFGSDRILTLHELTPYRRIKARSFIPLWIAGPLLRHIFQPLLARLQQGDIVWCHNQPIFAAALEKEIHLKGAKLVYHCHDGLTGYPLRKAFKLFTPDAYVFVSEYLRQNFLHIFPWLRNTYTLHNGADEALFYPRQVRDGIDKTVPTILFVGRLHPVKGVHILLEAMSILQRRKVSAKCKVVGSSFSGGSKVTPYVKQLLKSSPSNVSFVGHRSALDIAEEYRSADILCCPSIWQEAFGMVNIEAMACGIPVVASRVGGIPEIAAGGGILLVEPDSPIELADALQKLIENRGLRAKVAADGLFSFQQQFAWTTINKQYESIVRRLI